MTWALLILLFLVSAYASRQVVLRRRIEVALKDARATVEKREMKMRTILENAPVVFSAVDNRGVFHVSEGKGLEKLGRNNNQSVGKNIFEMHNHNPVILNAVTAALRGERVATSFVLNNISYELFMGPELNAEGVIVGASMLSVDVSDQKKIEEERAQALIREQTAVQTTRLKSEFLATMSHEIRTPLNGVIGMTSILLDTPLDSQQREYAEAIKQSGAGLLSVINDILDFSKIEAGKLDFEVISFNLPELIHHACKGPSILAANKGLKFVADVPSTLETWVGGDPGRVRQILNNLVGNAIKFTNEGEVTVRAQMIGNSSRVRIEVEDTGIGLSEEAKAKMFTPFSQGEASMARRFGGTGLGLSISKQLVEKMGGKIGVNRARETGSIFWFELEFAPGETPKEVLAKSEDSTFFFTGDTAPKILVAEDNKVNQLITVRMLEKLGCMPSVVTDGIEALEALKHSRFDLILMDCQMPNMDGLEATRRIRALDSTTSYRDIPIIAMTANAMKGDKETCIEAGMNDYVSKPVAFEELRKKVNRWLGSSRARANRSA